MQSLFHDTIAAIATPTGRGGVGIIRVSGGGSLEIARKLLNLEPKPRYATFCSFLDQNNAPIDQGLALFFKAPHSFTGEDVLELHAHGSKIILDLLLQRLVELGVRLARPGEFSERAFLNNKIDLVQAEAIADLIDASSKEAAQSAIRSLQGKFSQEIRHLVDEVIKLRMYVEAAIDFPEEEIDFLSDGKILSRLQELVKQLDLVLSQARQGTALNEGMKVVIAGHPNAGKSSLLNYFSGQESAIVSDIPGTTRDVIKESILIDGLPLQIVDTAGLRVSEDVIELEGVRRAWSEVPHADCILLVIDAVDVSEESLPEHDLVKQFADHKDKLTIIRNKIDLTSEEYKIIQIQDITVINTSVKKGLGMNFVKEHLKACMGYRSGENIFIARRRHLEALKLAQIHFDQALDQLVVAKAGELVAHELREAQNALSEITGEFRSDDLLGQIFSSFCIGK